LLQIAYFLAKSTEYFNENSVCRLSQFMAIFIQSNLRENRLFANEWQLVSKKGSHNVKFCAENFTHSPMARSEIYPELVVRLLITGCLLFSLLPVCLSLVCGYLPLPYSFSAMHSTFTNTTGHGLNKAYIQTGTNHNRGFKFHCTAIKE
jgi:hypothetical protein